jgi:hypothetical protein
MKNKCYSSEELLRYWQEKIPDKEKEEIERHVYGKKCRSIVDEHFGAIDMHDQKGCAECFKKLANTVSVGSETLKHL